MPVKRRDIDSVKMPLATICGILPFSKLCEKLAGIRTIGLGGSLRSTFLKATAGAFSGHDSDDQCRSREKRGEQEKERAKQLSTRRLDQQRSCGKRIEELVLTFFAGQRCLSVVVLAFRWEQGRSRNRGSLTSAAMIHQFLWNANRMHGLRAGTCPAQN